MDDSNDERKIVLIRIDLPLDGPIPKERRVGIE
jgi:hypothetical protein